MSQGKIYFAGAGPGDIKLITIPMILGHANRQVLDEVKKVMAKGASFGIPTRLETKLAKMIAQAIDTVEKVRLVNSGTEAVMTAIRLARGCTGRDKIIKFIGCYHGHVDHLLVGASSGAMTFSSPSSPGVPKDFTKHTILLPYNDTVAIEKAFGKYADKIAAVIVEPVAGNMGVVPPKQGFLKTIRKLCTAKRASTKQSQQFASFHFISFYYPLNTISLPASFRQTGANHPVLPGHHCLSRPQRIRIPASVRQIQQGPPNLHFHRR